MAIPDYQSLMLPLLTLAADGSEHSIRDAREHLAAELRLTDAERSELLPSGRQQVFDNRVAWAKTYLQRAGLLHFPRRAHFRWWSGPPQGWEELDDVARFIIETISTEISKT